MLPPQQIQPVAASFTNILTRLRTVLPKDFGYVRVVVRPNPELEEYRAEEGVHCVLGSPSPQPTSGAGRWGYKVTRPLVVYVCTRSHLDQVGRDELALGKHVTLEESVVNAVLDGHPLVGTREGILIAWVPGGQEASRAVPDDVGMLTSMLVFELSYAINLTPGPGPAQ